MDVRVLKYFITVAREENITKAAKILHLTQPTLSRQLQQLEDELKVTLFHRSSHSIVLTEKGKIFLERAKEIIALCEVTQEEMSQQNADIQGEIRIGCGETKGMDFLTKQIAEFQKKYPKVRVCIYSMTADLIHSCLENGQLHMGLMTEPVSVDRYQYLRIDEYDTWGILVRKDHSLGRKTAVTKKDLAGERLILPVRDQVRGELASWFGEYKDSLIVSGTCNLMLNEVAMVKNRIGTAVCLDLPVYDKELCFVPLQPELKTGSVLVWKEENHDSAVCILFLKYLRKRLIEKNSL